MILHFVLRPGRYAIARLAPEMPVPSWATRGKFFSITRTDEELSIIAEEGQVPDGRTVSRGWCLLHLRGPFAFTEIGVAAAFTAVLAERSISVLVVSTYDTDALLVTADQVDRAVAALTAAGHIVDPGRPDA